MYAQFESNANLTNYFLEALRLETQSGTLRWAPRTDNDGSMYCIIDNRMLELTHNQIDEQTDAHKLISTCLPTGEQTLLMGSQSHVEAPCELRELYDDIVEALDEEPDDTVIHVQTFIRQSAERQCLYALIDTLKLLQNSITSILKGTQ